MEEEVEVFLSNFEVGCEKSKDVGDGQGNCRCA